MTVCDKAEALTAGVPLYAENGQSAEEILYECALAMVGGHGVCCNSHCVHAQGREAASFELLTDSQTARKHYGIAFACLHLLRAESTSEADHTVSLSEVDTLSDLIWYVMTGFGPLFEAGGAASKRTLVSRGSG